MMMARRLGRIWSTEAGATMVMQRWHSVRAPERRSARSRSCLTAAWNGTKLDGTETASRVD
ncbi:Os02g0499300 [Oryza sativa Japonica Group]|uniref:Os02g0499300 protein n=1 Tax=Oryza sativa subsp. japonica TaxID=39947 RepID=Q6K3N1_ORYSJ|nr:unknown protein [Oryza sativa Japonica Group]BAH91702.1 Os02g0499300 [Oryza sativa Japonica Group]|eukprot:NP_001172973.1 Os02g0499300 [Oryza sativa Japonica Group]